MLHFNRNYFILALLFVSYFLVAYTGIVQADVLKAKAPGEIETFVDNTAFTFGTYKNENFEIFNKPLFDFHNKKVEPENTSNNLAFSIAASPGEFEPLTFFVRAIKATIDDIQIQVDDLVSQTGDIFSSKNIDVKCVKIWPQAGQWKFIEKKDVLVPELLLYDCCEDLITTKTEKIPTLPTISKKLKVKIEKGTSQQFWITVRVPKNTNPETYEGQLNVKVKGMKTVPVPFTLSVLPIDLLDPVQEYLMYYKPYPTIPMAIIEKQLIDMRNHGVTGARVPGFRENEFKSFLTLAKKHGFKKLIFSFRQCIEKKAIIQSSGFPLICYGVDEPNRLKTKEYKKSLRHHIALSNDVHANGGKVMTAILMTTAEILRNPKSEAYDLIDPRTEGKGKTKKSFRDQNIINEALDFTVYWVEGLLYEDWQKSKSLVRFMDYIQLPKNHKKDTVGKEFYYWQMWKDLPHMNRLLCGFFLWQSGLDGVMPYVYQGRYKSNAFNDRESGRYRQLMVTYPSLNGPIPTLKWEEFREGYDDIRYLTTLFNLISEFEKIDSIAASAVASDVKKDLIKFNHPFAFKSLKSSDFQNIRKLIVTKILELSQLLNLLPTNSHAEFL
jgi:hypothetical protein